MRMILGLLILFLVILTVLLGLSIGVGFVLKALLPAIDFGIAVLIGMLASAISLYFILRIMTSLPIEVHSTDIEVDDDDGEEQVVEPVRMSRYKRRKPPRQ